MRQRLVFALLTLLAAGGVAFAVTASAPPPQRELTLVARGMAFYLPGDTAPNPTLVVGRGERLRLVLRNADAGMSHDLVVESLDVATPLLRGAGTEAAIELRAPAVPGEHAYVCSTHAAMMRGTLLVR